MTVQQQQALIHSILLKQLKEKQQIAISTSISGVSPSSTLPQPQPSSSVASKENGICILGYIYIG
jgi:hypothetical protein